MTSFVGLLLWQRFSWAMLILFLASNIVFSQETEIGDEKKFWQPYQELLDQVVLEGNYKGRYGVFFHHPVDYKKIKEDKKLDKLFDHQIEKLVNLKKIPDASLKIKKNDSKKIKTSLKNQSLAFWINIYNFYTLEQLKRNIRIYDVESMKDIGWKKKEVKVGKNLYNLDEVENDKIRPFKDPRIHFAINCASVSCPTLVKAVLLSDTVDKSLKELTINAFKSPIHLRVEDSFFGKTLETTKLFSWYKKDWGSSADVMVFLRKFMPKDYRHFKDYSTGISYDWNLNTQKNVDAHIKELKKEGYWLIDD